MKDIGLDKEIASMAQSTCDSALCVDGDVLHRLAFLEDVLQLSDDWFWQVDGNARATFISARVKDVLGYSQEELMGSNLLELLEVPEQQKLQSFFSHIPRGGESFQSLELIIMSKDGRPVTIRASGHPVCDDDENVIGYRGLCRDISRLVDQQRALRMAMNAVENSADRLNEAQRITKLGSWVYQRNGKRLHCSKQLHDIFELQPLAEPSLAGFTDKIHPSDKRRVRSLQLNAYRDHESYRIVHRLLIDAKVKVVEQRGYAEYDSHGAIVAVVGTVQDISRRDLLERQLGEQEKRYRMVFDATQQPLLLLGYNAEILACNQALVSLLGYSRDDQLVGQKPQHLSPPCQPDGVMSTVKARDHIRAVREFGFMQFDWTHVKRDGTPVPVQVSLREVSEDGNLYLLASLYDLSDRYRARELEAQTMAVFKNAVEGIMIASAKNEILAVNPAFTKITGFAQHEVLGKNPSILSSGRHPKEFYQSLWAQVNRKGVWSGEIVNRRKSGEIYTQWLNISHVLDESAKVRNYIATFTDITEKRKTAERIEYLSHYDVVTGLHNIEFMREKFAKQLLMAGDHSKQLAIVCCNLDGFKRIISRYGYEVGDSVLKSFGQLLTTFFDGDVNVSRLSADSFVVVVACSEGGQIKDVVGLLQKHLRNGLDLPAIEERCVLNCSVGVSFYPQHGEQPNVLINNAESAMREAKKLGVGKLAFYRREMTDQVNQSLELERALYEALSCEEFVLFYQPKVSLGAAKISAFEALIRWKQGDKILPPKDFMPTVESSDLVIDVGKWVITEAIRNLAEWRDKGIEVVPVSVNVSRELILRKDLPSFIESQLARFGIEPHYFGVEILENLLFDDPEQAAEQISRIRDLGICISLDDFGTGFSNLSYLQRFSIDELKIDRRFISYIDRSPEDLSIVRSTIAMAHSLGLKTIAEGVETDAQLGLLASLGCDHIQGYRVAKPMPANRIVEFLVSHAEGFSEPLNGLLHHAVLVVDDSAHMRHILRLKLESLGYYVIEAEDGQKGLEMLQTRQVRCVITDYVMPEMDGIEFLSEVKAAFPDVRRILVSAAEEQYIIVEAVNRAGISGFLPKPFGLDELKKALS